MEFIKEVDVYTYLRSVYVNAYVNDFYLESLTKVTCVVAVHLLYLFIENR